MVCQGIKTLLRISISCNLNNFARACPAKNFVEVEMLPWSSSYWREFRSIIPYGTSTGNGKTFVVAEISLKRTSLCRDSTVYCTHCYWSLQKSPAALFEHTRNSLQISDSGCSEHEPNTTVHDAWNSCFYFMDIWKWFTVFSANQNKHCKWQIPLQWKLS